MKTQSLHELLKKLRQEEEIEAKADVNLLLCINDEDMIAENENLRKVLINSVITRREEKKAKLLDTKLSDDDFIILLESTFAKFDDDSSGTLSFNEFKKVLESVNINVNDSKARRYFEVSDEDKSGAIDLIEFKAALLSLRSSDFKFPDFDSPGDAFFFFDQDKSGFIDEDEFAELIEFMSIKIDDKKQEKLFLKHCNSDNHLNFQAFSKVYSQLVEPLDELKKRGVDTTKMNKRKAKKKFKSILLKEEKQENLQLKYLIQYREFENDRCSLIQLIEKAIVIADRALTIALNALGQVRITGKVTFNNDRRSFHSFDSFALSLKTIRTKRDSNFNDLENLLWGKECAEAQLGVEDVIFTTKHDKRMRSLLTPGANESHNNQQWLNLINNLKDRKGTFLKMISATFLQSVLKSSNACERTHKLVHDAQVETFSINDRTLLFQTDETVWCLGPHQAEPRKLHFPFSTKISSFASGTSESLMSSFDADDHSLYSIGNGGFLNKRFTDRSSSPKPRKMNSWYSPRKVNFNLKKCVTYLSCSSTHAALILDGGRLFTWGSTVGGKLGHCLHFSEAVASLKETEKSTCLLKRDQVIMNGSLLKNENILLIPTEVDLLQGIKIIDVSCGKAHTVAVSVEGKAFGTGSPSAFGTFTPGFTDLNLTDVHKVSCGSDSTWCLSKSGEIYAFGRNDHGKLGIEESIGFVHWKKPHLLRSIYEKPSLISNNKRSKQSSTFDGNTSSNALNYDTADYCCTQFENFPWWEIDLGKVYFIEKIMITNRVDEPDDVGLPELHFKKRLYPCHVFTHNISMEDVSFQENSRNEECFDFLLKSLPGTHHKSFELADESANAVKSNFDAGIVRARYVRLQIAKATKTFFHVTSVKVFGRSIHETNCFPVTFINCGDKGSIAVCPSTVNDSNASAYLHKVRKDHLGSWLLKNNTRYSQCQNVRNDDFEPCVECKDTGDVCDLCVFFDALIKYNRKYKLFDVKDVKKMPLLSLREGLRKVKLNQS